MRKLALGLALVAAGCGGGGGSGSAAPPPNPPKRTSGGPPPAWVEAPGGAHWLAYAGWTWRKGNRVQHADALPPRCGDERTPDVTAAPGDELTFHLGFDPKAVRVGSETLEPSRDPTWKVKHGGLVVVSAEADAGEAAYALCIRF